MIRRLSTSIVVAGFVTAAISATSAPPPAIAQTVSQSDVGVHPAGCPPAIGCN